INTKDAARAKRFYTSLFGWKYKDSEIPGIEYYVIDGIEPGGAINPMQSDQKSPVVYFGTDDIDDTLRKGKESGGTADDRQPTPGQGYFAACTDPEGNTFSPFPTDPSVT